MGSVGTSCFIVLLAAVVDLDPLFFQIKEAQPSVLAPFVGRSSYNNQGQRVVVGQRVMQAASDVFLGWARADGFDAYVRQLRDMKGSAVLGAPDPSGLVDYGRLCGATLARAHGRAGEPAPPHRVHGERIGIRRRPRVFRGGVRRPERPRLRGLCASCQLRPTSRGRRSMNPVIADDRMANGYGRVAGPSARSPGVSRSPPDGMVDARRGHRCRLAEVGASHGASRPRP